MTAGRYFVLAAESARARREWKQANSSVVSGLQGFDLQCFGTRLLVVARPEATVRIGSAGLLLGSAFETGGAQRIRAIDRAGASSLIASRGMHCVDNLWGAYVAAFEDPQSGSIELLRSPLGHLACYFTDSLHGMVCASDVDLLGALAGFQSQPSWRDVARHLAVPDLRRPATCLKGLSELSGGERLTERGGRSETVDLWNVWRFADKGARIFGAEEAAQQVSQAVRGAVAAQASSHSKILLKLSGGIDSSIVAACLADAGTPFVALTLTTADKGGDERVHARAVASRLGVDLVEALRVPGLVDLGRSAAAGLPRPSAHGFAQATRRLCETIAAAHAATVVFDGGGGDNVFASLQSPAPVADCLGGSGGVPYFWRTARSIGIAAQTATWEVAWRGVWRRFWRGPRYRWPTDLTMLSEDAAAMASGADRHPWLDPPPGALAGSGGHMALLAAAQSVVQSPDPRRDLAEMSPLISQPVAEACLRIPSWLWTRDGRNRVAARDAFRGSLPADVVDRRDKGAMDSFLFELIEANRALVRDVLLDGVLARQNIIDRSAVETAMTPARMARGHGYMRLMQLVDVEVWARSWADR